MDGDRKTFMLPAGRHPENATVLHQIYTDFLKPIDLLRLIKPIFVDTHFKVHVLAAYFFIIGLSTFVGFSFLATAFILIDNIGLATFSANMFIIYVTGLAIIFQIMKVSWTKGVTTIDNLVMIIHGREDHCTYTGILYDAYLKNRRRRILRYGTMFYVYLIVSTHLMYILLPPVFDALTGATRPPYDVDNGVAMTLAVPMWTPLDADHSWVDYCIVCMMQMIFLATAGVIIGLGVFYNVCSQMSMLDEMKLLIRSVDELETRTTDLFKKKYPNQSLVKYSEEYDKCYFDCLKENIIHHHFILRTFAEYQNLVSFTLAIPFFSASIIIALFSAHVISDDRSIVKKSIEVMHMVIDIALMIIMCHFGQQITEKNENLRDSFYNTDWFNRSKRVKRAISTCMHATYVPMQLLVGNIMILNNENFSLIVNSAYSTFNIFYAAQTSEK